jgi:hypothetical protein
MHFMKSDILADVVHYVAYREKEVWPLLQIVSQVGDHGEIQGGIAFRCG